MQHKNEHNTANCKKEINCEIDHEAQVRFFPCLEHVYRSHHDHFDFLIPAYLRSEFGLPLFDFCFSWSNNHKIGGNPAFFLYFWSFYVCWTLVRICKTGMSDSMNSSIKSCNCFHHLIGLHICHVFDASTINFCSSSSQMNFFFFFFLKSKC